MRIHCSRSYGTPSSGRRQFARGSGFTRLAKSIDLNGYPDLKSVVLEVLAKFELGADYLLAGTYLNYYKDGNMFTPNHSHPGMHQLVISLGATRGFTIGKQLVPLNSGDTIMFGSAVHGIPKQPEVGEGRISIAIFLKKLE